MIERRKSDDQDKLINEYKTKIDSLETELSNSRKEVEVVESGKS